MSMLDTALDCIRRGWYVFPCHGKLPAIPKSEGGQGYKDASLDEDTIRAWWTRWPDANPGIAVGSSGLTVLDIDTGLTSADDYVSWCLAHDIPNTLVVRTGKRPDFRLQIYFKGTVESLNGWSFDGLGGDIRGTWGHVMAPGSIHPDSGEPYTILSHNDLMPVPNVVRGFRSQVKEKLSTVGDEGPITEWRNAKIISELGRIRAAGASDNIVRLRALELNDRCVPPLDEDELERLILNACNFPVGNPDPVPVLGTTPREESDTPATPPRDWREKYHTREQMLNAPPVNWVIKDFLPEESICGLGAPAGQRKSLIALNVAHACLTGEPLFGKFPVVMKPERVLYLCPEMGIRSFTDRLRRIGLTEYIGEKLFCMTMSSPELVELKELTEDEVQGSLVILDTAIRYLKGDENSSEAMKEFAKEIFRLSKAGALAVLVLHHSGKGAKSSDELTLENCMRGSGEIGAFLTTCWGTRINGDDAYKSPSYLQNVKQRDAIYEALEVSSDDLSCRLTYVEKPEGAKAVLKTKKPGPKPREDDPAALAIVKSTAWLSDRALVQVLKDNGITRSRDWVRDRLADIKRENGGLMPSKPSDQNHSIG